MLALTLSGLLALSQAAEPNSTSAAATEAPKPAAPKAEAPAVAIQLTTLDLLLKKGLISDSEYAQARRDMAELGDKAGSATTVVVGKFATTLYVFIEADMIHDDTRSFVDLAGNTTVASPTSEAGSNPRTMFGVRNSRLGFRLSAPEVLGLRASAMLETDFLGNQPGTPPLTSSGSSFKEGAYWNNPALRIRHAVMKIDSDSGFSLWVGQTWELVGFQSDFQPNSVEIQGLPGEIYSRTPQLRLVYDYKISDVGTVEVAVAALRPPQADAQLPDFQGGVRFTLDTLKGLQTIGATGTATKGASVGISGASRSFTLATSASKTNPQEKSLQGNVIAGDLMIPAIPPSLHLPVALTLIGESSFGSGDADLFTNLSGGVGVGTPAGYPACPTTGVACYPASYNPGIDPGLMAFNRSGNPELVDWRSVLVGFQLYLPPDYKLWVSANYSSMYSDNSIDFGASTLSQSWFVDANVFYDLTPSVRFGFEYARFTDNFNNATQAYNNRLQLSGFFIF